MDLKETVLQKELLYGGKVVHLEKWIVALPDGRQALREVVQHVGAVAVVACDDQGRIYMVWQYRVALGRVMLEIPAGKLDAKTEDHLEAARRELREETGLTADNWLPMTNLITTPGFCDEQIALFLATGLHAGKTDLDEDEFLTARPVPAAELYEKIYAGEIHDAKTVCALLYARPLLEKAGLLN